MIFVHAGFGDRAVPYEEGWELQRRTHRDRVAGETEDTVILLEHEPVYTAGKRTEPLDRPLGDPGAPVIDVDRGGKITWHGPGQLTFYPIVKLPDPIDVVAFVRLLEEAMIDVMAEFGLTGVRVEGRSGVWLVDGVNPDRKLVSVGLRVSQGVTMHGVQINCDCDLSWFDRIVPCGLKDVTSTSLTRELGRPVAVREVLPVVEKHLAARLDAQGAAHRALAQP
ncbi:lipoyl(octanoyl) transferase LipB [Actinocorallia libanotica]|uniref:Octanoyltransferase n=1 Tax=Actinocorallia libanotica TaxID=46162 RepID=A0ABN1RYI8_9ACTN